ncbi:MULTISPECIES: glycine cleavage system protein GcvH [unclassified Mycolicibacterium]|uniref:glycine cleavage system protein GcvH n=2 Tax=Mycolicibacterium TaxID=1866885 RepID=UPI0012DD80E7|nr:MULTISPECIES: glycine cleavage system protein GcvH [unclassified Mycolicibacterium]MUL82034.1 glycine cleavage system protein GcvH [Mycolicibacterium sp. CBMA 329]MUL87800.1 glycine cleavage system protein GcvH [Mycolicibacterium sp. CBMA 331]MUM01624.1 glycine cleavage system protein GcvH [Mycolicibacterium sp. CBMA 334]MUM38097.1 glycine cleavage system protein GcvH [Mycolicibacterium sp. CBMA 247]MUM43865.1 glycine cleavage system protein GcvH [Mycolicibacterium sp. CBMA 294]
MTNQTIPDDRSYTEEHEWVLIAPGAALPDTPVRVGITSVAAAALGDLVFLDLPEVGASIVAGETCGEVESTKTVSELYPPVSGTVTAVNTAAVDDPALVTSDPYESGWLFEVQATAAGNLLTAAEYAQKSEA